MFILFAAKTPAATIENAKALLVAADFAVRTYHPARGPMLNVVDGDVDKVRSLLNGAGIDAPVYAKDRLPLVGRGLDEASATVRLGNTLVGGPALCVLAGPCSVDTEELTLDVAKAIGELGATGLRGGAFKPRTSPYAFEGLEEEGLRILASARDATGLPVVTEALDNEGAALVGASADAIQIGARTSQAFSLLHAAGAQGKPVVLKRGFGCTIDETLHAAEHAMAHGASGIIFIERGIRTFEQSARFTLDLSGALRLKQQSRFPVLIDPSHAAGDVSLISPLSRAAIAAGLDGIMVEVHADPVQALSDKHQALTVSGFAALLDDIRPIAAAVDRTLAAPTGRTQPPLHSTVQAA